MSENNEEGTPNTEEKKGAGAVLLEELTPEPPKTGSWVRNAAQSLVVPVLAVLTGLIFSGIFIFLTTTEVLPVPGPPAPPSNSRHSTRSI